MTGLLNFLLPSKNMELSQEQIQQIVQEATESLKLKLKSDLMAGLEPAIRSTAQQAVRQHVERWISENVLPSVTIMLEEGKASLEASAIEGASLIAEELAEAMKKSAHTSLQSSLYRRRIFEALFSS